MKDKARRWCRAGQSLPRARTRRHVHRVLLFEYFPETVGSVQEAEATFTYERGRKYVFYLEWFKRERGQLTGRLAGWDPEPLEIAEEAVGSPQGEPPPF